MKISKKMQQLILLISIASFLGTAITGMAHLLITEVSSQPQGEAPTMTEVLKTELQGYEAVLQREPDNSTALEGVANARLQLGDAKGAIAPLEKLVKLYPDRADYKAWLAVAQQNSSDADGTVIEKKSDR